jgi:hypothetical protein
MRASALVQASGRIAVADAAVVEDKNLVAFALCGRGQQRKDATGLTHRAKVVDLSRPAKACTV